MLGAPAAPIVVPTMTPDERQMVVVALGVIGGLGVGYYAVRHMFVQGLTPDERSNMLRLAASAAIYIGVTQLVDPAYQQYLDPLHIMTPEE